MEILVVIEALEIGAFRARTSEVLNLTAEGPAPAEATRHLRQLCDSALASGKQLATITVANGQVDVLPATTLADNLYKTDWVYRELEEAIAENRRQDEAANP